MQKSWWVWQGNFQKFKRWSNSILFVILYFNKMLLKIWPSKFWINLFSYLSRLSTPLEMQILVIWDEGLKANLRNYIHVIEVVNINEWINKYKMFEDVRWLKGLERLYQWLESCDNRLFRLDPNSMFVINPSWISW